MIISTTKRGMKNAADTREGENTTASNAADTNEGRKCTGKGIRHGADAASRETSAALSGYPE
jgi:hypothetical protein